VTAPDDLRDVVSSYISSEEFRDPDQKLYPPPLQASNPFLPQFFSFGQHRKRNKPQTPPEDTRASYEFINQQLPPKVHRRKASHEGTLTRTTSLPELKSSENPTFLLESDGRERFHYGNYKFERERDEEMASSVKNSRPASIAGSTVKRSWKNMEWKEFHGGDFESGGTAEMRNGNENGSSAKWLVGELSSRLTISC